MVLCFPLQGQVKVKRPDQCCEECASTKGTCMYEGAVRYHGDMWNGTGCEFCTCERGQVLCQRAECARLTCSRVREPSFTRQHTFQHRTSTAFITAASLEDIASQHCGGPESNLRQFKQALTVRDHKAMNRNECLL